MGGGRITGCETLSLVVAAVGAFGAIGAVFAVLAWLNVGRSARVAEDSRDLAAGSRDVPRETPASSQSSTFREAVFTRPRLTSTEPVGLAVSGGSAAPVAKDHEKSSPIGLPARSSIEAPTVAV